MLSEGRKRDAAANAVLALSFAANAAQSPQSFVTSGKTAAPGVIQMQRTIGNPRKKPKDLGGSSVLMRGSKLKEGKTFREFLEEAYLTEIHKTREDAEAYYKENPPVGGDPYYIRNKGPKKGWQAIRKSSFKKQKERRSQKLKGLTYKEILAFTKRNLKPNPSELAKKAQKIESGEKSAQTREARNKTQETGTKHVVDHNQPQQDKRRPGNRERFERVVPGDVSSNRSVLPEPENLSKGSKPPKKGERGYGTTRSGAIKKVVDKAEAKQQ